MIDPNAGPQFVTKGGGWVKKTHEEWRERALIDMWWQSQFGGRKLPPVVAKWLSELILLSMLR